MTNSSLNWVWGEADCYSPVWAMERIYALVMLTFMNIKIERLAPSLIYLGSNYLSSLAGQLVQY